MEELNSSPIVPGLFGYGPVVTKRLFAQLTGLTEETVRGMIERGHLPTLKVGKHRMINVALMTKDALECEFEM